MPEKRLTTLAPWAQEVLQRAHGLRDLLEHVDAEHREHLADLLGSIERLSCENVPLWRWTTRLPDWWFGSRVERSWSLLHEAELLFVEYADHRGMEIALDNALGYAMALPNDDPVRLRFEAYVQSLADGHPNGDKPAATATASAPATEHAP